MTSDATDGC